MSKFLKNNFALIVHTLSGICVNSFLSGKYFGVNHSEFSTILVTDNACYRTLPGKQKRNTNFACNCVEYLYSFCVL